MLLESETSINLMERIRDIAPDAAIRMVPVDEHVIFLTLASEAAQAALVHAGEGASFLTNRHTAAHSHGLNELVRNGFRAIVSDGVPASWAGESGVEGLERPKGFHDKDHFLFIVSNSFSFALVGTANLQDRGRTAAFTGGWTVHREQVLQIAEALFGPAIFQHYSRLPDTLEGAEDMVALSMGMMARQADDLATRQRDAVMDKADLLTVLNILKAISSKRRAHDILFVFVEQVARVVNCERCSIVRIWGSEERGRVLASHEDPTIVDHGIDLEKYPELGEALRRREKLVMNQALSHPLMQGVKEGLARAHINSLLVIPIVLFDETVGSLFLRAARSEGSFTVREISFFEIVAEAASNALERAHLFESIQIANERLERLAITDGLTGLHNHRHFRERFDQEFERAKRYRLPLSCIMFDVDNFKLVNDTYGHLTGDAILREIGIRSVDTVRKLDFVARYGGEEFAIIMPQTDLDGATVEGERLRERIAETPFPGLPDGEQITVSVGIAVLNHDTMNTSEDLLRLTDQALYDAKNTGKNKVVVG